MPAMLFGRGQESIAPQGAPTDPTTPPCRSGPCPRCSSNTDRRASRPRALLQTPAHHPVGAGHARDALRTRTGKHRALGRSYSAFAPIPNPHRIPKRVVAHAFHQPCPDGIGDQIARGSSYVIVPTQQLVVIRACPERSGTPPVFVVGARGGGLDAVHDRGQMIAITDLDQPMPVVRHQHPRQQSRIAADVGVEMAARGRAGGCEFAEEGVARQGGRGHQVRMAWQMDTMAPERCMAGVREEERRHARQLLGWRAARTSGTAAPNCQIWERAMPAMLFGHGRESIAPEGAPTDPTTPSVGAGHARDALRARTGERRAPGRSYRPHHTLCRSGPCPRCSSGTDRKASRPRALLQIPPHHLVGAGHARDALRTRTGKHRARGRSYRARHATL
jgi:hypothetical protein